MQLSPTFSLLPGVRVVAVAAIGFKEQVPGLPPYEGTLLQGAIPCGEMPFFRRVGSQRRIRRVAAALMGRGGAEMRRLYRVDLPITVNDHVVHVEGDISWEHN